MFLFKKIVGPLLFPVPIVFFLLLVGVVLLWAGKRRRLARAFVTASLIVLAIAAFRPVSYGLLGNLEHTYATYSAEQHASFSPQWIVVLGGGTAEDPDLPANINLSDPSLARLVEGIRILRMYPNAGLLLSGHMEAGVMKETALMLGVPIERIHLDGVSRDTKDQAVRLKSTVGSDPFVLVTSAPHMRRAAALFRRQGMFPVPAPADRQVKPGIFYPANIYPNDEHITAITKWCRESLGYLWASLRGQV